MILTQIQSLLSPSPVGQILLSPAQHNLKPNGSGTPLLLSS